MRDPHSPFAAKSAASAAEAPSSGSSSEGALDYTGALRSFHQAIGEPAPLRPTLPSADLLRIRRTLLSEEWAEVQEELDLLQARLAAGQAQSAPAELHRLAHELTDLLYVTYGTLTQLGIDPAATFAAVHQANLGKVGGPLRADGKLLKPEGWQPADIRGVLERLSSEPELPGD